MVSFEQKVKSKIRRKRKGEDTKCTTKEEENKQK